MTEHHHAACYVEAARRWVVACAIVPLFLFLAPFEFACFPWRAALFHLAYGFTLSLLLADILFLGFRRVPFTCTYFAGKVNLIGLAALYVLGFTTYSDWMARVELWLYPFPAAAAVFFLGALAARRLLALWRRRTLADAPTLEYTEDKPEIRTLGIEYR